MFTSTEDQEPFLRDSKYLTGQQLRNQRDGNLISTQEELGTMLSTISDQNGHQLLSQEKDQNLTSYNGSDLNNGVKDSLQDFSTTKYLRPDGSDTEDTQMIQRKLSIPSLMQTKNNLLSLVLIQQPQKEEKLLRKNGKLQLRQFLNSFQRTKLSTLMNINNT